MRGMRYHRPKTRQGGQFEKELDRQEVTEAQKEQKVHPQARAGTVLLSNVHVPDVWPHWDPESSSCVH